MREFLHDLKFGLRLLVQGRLISVIIIVTLALGIGVTSTIVSLVGTVLVNPFPGVHDAARIAWFFERKGEAPKTPQNNVNDLTEVVPPIDYLRWKQELTQFEELAALKPARRTVEAGGEPERASGFAITPNYFHLLGTSVRWGREFTDEEVMPGHEHVAILGHAFAERRFGQAAIAVGKTIAVQGILHTVVGVLSPSFAFPGLTDLWIPLVIDDDMRANRGEARFVVFGKLKPHVTTEAVNTEVDAVARRLASEFPETHRGLSAQVVVLPDVFIGNGRVMLGLTLLAALLTLLVAATNVGNILFARGIARRSEFALRAALGASRARLIRQVLTECSLLGAAGGGLALLISMWGLDWFFASIPERMANRMRIFLELRLDWTWIVVTMGLTILTIVAAGLWPALRVSDLAAGEALKEQSNHATTGREHRRIMKTLATGQVTIALALLTGTAWEITELVKAEREDLGCDPHQVLEGQIARDGQEPKEAVRFFADLRERLRGVPGVEAVSLVSVPPLNRVSETVQIAIPGRPAPPPGEEALSNLTIIDGDFLSTIRTTLSEGRVFDNRDREGSPPVAMLSRQAAKALFPGGSAIGKTLYLPETKISCTIVGIVNDIAIARHPEIGAIYRPLVQEPRSEMFVLLRSTTLASMLERPLLDAVHVLDRRQPVQVNPLSLHVDEWLWPPRTTARLIAIPSALAVLLALLGVYGVASYSVNQRRTELGIRAALGASPRALVRLVMREALWIGTVGATFGLAISFALTATLGRTTGTQALSGPGVVALGATLFAVVLLASYGPARRAANASPSLAIRS